MLSDLESYVGELAASSCSDAAPAPCLARALVFGDAAQPGGEASVDCGGGGSRAAPAATSAALRGAEAALRDAALGPRVDRAMSAAIALLCGAPIALVSPRIVAGGGREMLSPAAALRAAAALLAAHLRPALAALPRSMLVALLRHTMLRAVAAPRLLADLTDAVARSGGGAALSAASGAPRSAAAVVVAAHPISLALIGGGGASSDGASTVQPPSPLPPASLYASADAHEDEIVRALSAQALLVGGGPGDLSLPYAHDADSRLHLPRSDRAATALFAAREQLRDAFLGLARDYRDVGASFRALSRQQIDAELPARAAALRALLAAALIPWFARLFLHEFGLFVRHEVLLHRGGGRAASALAAPAVGAAAAAVAAAALGPAAAARMQRLDSRMGGAGAASVLTSAGRGGGHATRGGGGGGSSRRRGGGGVSGGGTSMRGGMSGHDGGSTASRRGAAPPQRLAVAAEADEASGFRPSQTTAAHAPRPRLLVARRPAGASSAAARSATAAAAAGAMSGFPSLPARADAPASAPIAGASAPSAWSALGRSAAASAPAAAIERSRVIAALHAPSALAAVTAALHAPSALPSALAAAPDAVASLAPPPPGESEEETAAGALLKSQLAGPDEPGMLGGVLSGSDEPLIGGDARGSEDDDGDAASAACAAEAFFSSVLAALDSAALDAALIRACVSRLAALCAPAPAPAALLSVAARDVLADATTARALTRLVVRLSLGGLAAAAGSPFPADRRDAAADAAAYTAPIDFAAALRAASARRDASGGAALLITALCASEFLRCAGALLVRAAGMEGDDAVVEDDEEAARAAPVGGAFLGAGENGAAGEASVAQPRWRWWHDAAAALLELHAAVRSAAAAVASTPRAGQRSRSEDAPHVSRLELLLRARVDAALEAMPRRMARVVLRPYEAVACERGGASPTAAAAAAADAAIGSRLLLQLCPPLAAASDCLATAPAVLRAMLQREQREGSARSSYALALPALRPPREGKGAITEPPLSPGECGGAQAPPRGVMPLAADRRVSSGAAELAHSTPLAVLVRSLPAPPAAALCGDAPISASASPPRLAAAAAITDAAAAAVATAAAAAASVVSLRTPPTSPLGRRLAAGESTPPAALIAPPPPPPPATPTLTRSSSEPPTTTEGTSALSSAPAPPSPMPTPRLVPRAPPLGRSFSTPLSASTATTTASSRKIRPVLVSFASSGDALGLSGRAGVDGDIFAGAAAMLRGGGSFAPTRSASLPSSAPPVLPASVPSRCSATQALEALAFSEAEAANVRGGGGAAPGAAVHSVILAPAPVVAGHSAAMVSPLIVARAAEAGRSIAAAAAAAASPTSASVPVPPAPLASALPPLLPPQTALLISPRFQASLAAAWFSVEPEIEPVVEAAVHGALSSLRRAEAEASRAAERLAAADAAAGRAPASGEAASLADSDSAALLLRAAQARASRAVYALLGAAPACDSLSAAARDAAAQTSMALAADDDPAARAAAVAATAAAVASQLLVARARQQHHRM